MVSFLSKAERDARISWLVERSSYSGDDCVVWPWRRDMDGYPCAISFEGRMIRPNRILCKLSHGAPPADFYQVAHLCGNGHLGCFNPQHMMWKTPRDNHADMLVHGRWQAGSMNGAHKLVEAEVAIIKGLLIESVPQRQIAKRFGVTQATVSLIARGYNWTHVDARTGI